MIKEACITEKKKEYAPTHESLANISSKTDIVCNTKWCESDNRLLTHNVTIVEGEIDSPVFLGLLLVTTEMMQREMCHYND